MRASWVGSALLIAAVAVACKTETVNEVTLKFTRPGRLQRGFECKDAKTGAYLLSRLLANGGKGSLVVDYVLLGGLPHCRPLQLAEWCKSHPCPLDLQHRYCVPVDLPTDPATVIDALARKIDDLSGTLVSSNAPEDYLLVRAILTAQSCDALTTATDFDQTRLVGCVYSCPVLLSSVDGDLDLDLDITSVDCENVVDACATLNGDGASAKAQ